MKQATGSIFQRREEESQAPFNTENFGLFKKRPLEISERVKYIKLKENAVMGQCGPIFRKMFNKKTGRAEPDHLI